MGRAAREDHAVFGAAPELDSLRGADSLQVAAYHHRADIARTDGNAEPKEMINALLLRAGLSPAVRCNWRRFVSSFVFNFDT
jgi:hypothetical protein